MRWRFLLVLGALVYATVAVLGIAAYSLWSVPPVKATASAAVTALALIALAPIVAAVFAANIRVADGREGARNGILAVVTGMSAFALVVGLLAKVAEGHPGLRFWDALRTIAPIHFILSPVLLMAAAGIGAWLGHGRARRRTMAAPGSTGRW